MGSFLSISYEKLDLSLGLLFCCRDPSMELHSDVIPVNFREDTSEIGHCPWVGLPCWRCRALLVPIVTYVYILMQGFTSSPNIGPHGHQRMVIVLIFKFSNFFDPQIRKACQLQVQIIQEIQASIICMGDGRFPNCLPPARFTTVCTALLGF